MLAIAKSGWLVWLIRDNKRIVDFLKIPRRTDRRDPWASLKAIIRRSNGCMILEPVVFEVRYASRSYARNSSFNGGSWKALRADQQRMVSRSPVARARSDLATTGSSPAARLAQ